MQNKSVCYFIRNETNIAKEKRDKKKWLNNDNALMSYNTIDALYHLNTFACSLFLDQTFSRFICFSRFHDDPKSKMAGFAQRSTQDEMKQPQQHNRTSYLITLRTSVVLFESHPYRVNIILVCHAILFHLLALTRTDSPLFICSSFEK